MKGHPEVSHEFSAVWHRVEATWSKTQQADSWESHEDAIYEPEAPQHRRLRETLV